MSHGETVIVVVIISIGIVIVIVILLIVTKMITTVIIPILTSLRMWVSRDGLFSLGKASKVIQPPTHHTNHTVPTIPTHVKPIIPMRLLVSY